MEELRAFRGLVGQLNLAETIRKPNICLVSCVQSTVQSKSRIDELNREIRALLGTKNYVFNQEFGPLEVVRLQKMVFIDASYGGLSDVGTQTRLEDFFKISYK